MAESKVELVITADSSKAVKGIQDAEKATEKLNKTVVDSQKEQEKAIKETEKALTQLASARDRAHDPKKIAEYNRKIKEAKFELEQLKNAQVKSETASQSLISSIGKWALGLGGAAAASKLLLGAIKELTVGMNAFNMIGAVSKQVLNDLVTGMGFNLANIQKTIQAQKLLNELRLEEAVSNYKAAVHLRDYNKLYTEAADRTKTRTERIELLNKAQESYNKMIDEEVSIVKEQLTANQLLLAASPGVEKYMLREIELKTKLLELDTKRSLGVRASESMKTSLEKEEWEALWGRYMNEIDKANEKADEIARKEKERVKERYDLWLEYYDWYRDQIDKTIKDEERAAEAKWDFDMKYAKQLFDYNKRIAKEAWDILNPKETGKSQEEIEEEKWDNIIRITEDSVDKILDSYNELREGQFEDAQRHREILDQRISETQQSLETEIELYKAGYASNVSAYQSQLEELKVARDKALAEEEAARKRQLQIESAMQAASLASAVANLFSKETKKLGVLGIVSAGIGVAAMFAAFLASVARARSVTKLAEGGYGSETGLVTGRTHAEGGERFLDHVEIERGERWGVLNRKAAERFGHTFEDMVSSFNRNEMPDFLAGGNNIIVDNKGSNTRLDRVIKEQKIMNEKLDQNVMIGGHRKIITKGKNIRIVG